jgi:DNA-binding CsgD family transcriptional regulator
MGRKATVQLPPPRGLRVKRTVIGGEDVLLLSFPLDPIALPPGLTEVEREIVLEVARGASNADIARARGRSARTIANQLASIYGKLGVSGRAELVARLRGD